MIKLTERPAACLPEWGSGPWMTHSGRAGAGPLIGTDLILPPASLLPTIVLSTNCNRFGEFESLYFSSAANPFCLLRSTGYSRRRPADLMNVGL